MPLEVAKAEMIAYREKRMNKKSNSCLCVQCLHMNVCGNVFFLKDGTKTADSDDPSAQYFVISVVVLSVKKMITAGTG